MKKCINCGLEKPLEDYPAYKNRKGELAFKNKCKDCESVYKKLHYQKNKEKYLERAKRQREENPEEYKAYLKNYYRDNREELLKKQKAYYQTVKGQEVRNKCRDKYRATREGAKKERVRAQVNHALRDRKLIKPKYCSICSKETNLKLTMRIITNLLK